MRFGLVQAARPGVSQDLPSRYEEMFRELQLADNVGFDIYGLSEGHFGVAGIGTSAPEVLFGYAAGCTRQLRLRWTSALASTFNHPLRAAERLATLDIITEGRAELGLSCGTDPAMLEAFGISSGGMGVQWLESIEIVRRALVLDPLEYEGSVWHIPPTHVVPSPVQQPHPQLFSSARSIDAHREVGRLGIGVMTEFMGSADGQPSPVSGWEYLDQAAAAYRSSVEEASPMAGTVTRSLGLLLPVAHCAASGEQAISEAADELQRVFGSTGRYDLEDLATGPQMIALGSPEQIVERVHRLEEIGYDEVLLSIDALGHDANMAAIQLIGEEVIPTCR